MDPPPEVEHSDLSIKGGIRGLAGYGSNAFQPGMHIQGHPSDSNGP